MQEALARHGIEFNKNGILKMILVYKQVRTAWKNY